MYCQVYNIVCLLEKQKLPLVPQGGIKN